MACGASFVAGRLAQACLQRRGGDRGQTELCGQRQGEPSVVPFMPAPIPHPPLPPPLRRRPRTPCRAAAHGADSPGQELKEEQVRENGATTRVFRCPRARRGQVKSFSKSLEGGGERGELDEEEKGGKNYRKKRQSVFQDTPD